ncbi:MAG: ribonucleoside triphosphate reductase [Proteobacteria bacterium]|nr:ribonucleoside triphosphate reductase [Pseudomonadota bacterium]
MEQSMRDIANQNKGSESPFPFTSIVKRNGQVATFDANKITTAIQKAGEATGEFSGAMARRLMIRVVNLSQTLFDNVTPGVEEIQDVVEEVLLASPYKRTAKAYVLYRDQHAKLRDIASKADVDLVDSYLQVLDWKVHENSNMAYSLQGLNNYLSSEISKGYWLNKLYSPEIRDAHSSGDLHIHDLGQLSVYCVGWDLQDLLREGFTGVSGKAASSPASHFSSALGQVVNFFYTLQGEAAGAQAFSNFDTLLAPFIRYDKLDYKKVKQALQEFVFNVNVPTRVGFQSPFTNLTFDLIPPATIAGERVIIGGKEQQEVYGDFQEEMNIFNQAFLEVLVEGDADGRVFTFPIPTYNITPEFNWEDPMLEKLWQVTAKYGIPYFANYINSELSPEDARSMCCRLRLDTKQLETKGGGLFGSAPLTGSIGVVTVNMPRIGYLAKSESEFFERLDQLMQLAKISLETKRKVIERFTEQNLYPYSKFYLRNIRNRFDKYWHNHFSTIGIIGMNEACLNLMQCDIGTGEGVSFSLKVMDHMRRRLTEFQEETGHFYNLEATPAESTSYRLAKLDKEKFPVIQTANGSRFPEEQKPFYTNSTQLPVHYSDDLFQILDLQDPLQSKYTGGTVQHIFLGEAAPDHQAVKNFVQKICQGYHLPYFTISPTFSICPEHGYLNGEVDSCPACNMPTEVFSRIVGYLRPVSQWNEGKREEYSQRCTFKISG